MGRSRRRQVRTAPAGPRARRVAAPSPANLRRTLFTYLAGAVALAVVFLLGTLTLAGTLAPWVVLAFVAGAGLALFRWAQGHLAGQVLGDEERILQTLAAGLLILVTIFAAGTAIALSL